MEQERKRIVLVDDHIALRNGFKDLIEKIGPYEVVAEYTTGREFVEAFPLTPQPDLIIMDLTMPEMDGDEVVAIMEERDIQIPILIYSLIYDEARIIRLFRAGIRGYLEKDCTAATMRDALLEIFKSGYYHNEHFSMALKAPDRQKKSERDVVLSKLTSREREFLRLVCSEEEYTYDQIADLMGVVQRTVDGYRDAIFKKFDIKSKTGLVLFAIRHRIIDTDALFKGNR